MRSSFSFSMGLSVPPLLGILFCTSSQLTLFTAMKCPGDAVVFVICADINTKRNE